MIFEFIVSFLLICGVLIPFGFSLALSENIKSRQHILVSPNFVKFRTMFLFFPIHEINFALLESKHSKNIETAYVLQENTINEKFTYLRTEIIKSKHITNDKALSIFKDVNPEHFL